MHYDRNRDLPRLLPVWPHELEVDQDRKAHAALILKITRRCRAMRNAGVSRKPAYNGADHRALYTYLQYERAIYRDRWVTDTSSRVLDDCDLWAELGLPKARQAALAEERA